MEVQRFAHMSLIPAKHQSSDNPLTYYAAVGSQRCLRVQMHDQYGRIFDTLPDFYDFKVCELVYV